MRTIHEWCYYSHDKYRYTSTHDFIKVAGIIWSMTIIKLYIKWVKQNLYLFPWQIQQQIHRIGGFSWETVKIQNIANVKPDDVQFTIFYSHDNKVIL